MLERLFRVFKDRNDRKAYETFTEPDRLRAYKKNQNRISDLYKKIRNPTDEITLLALGWAQGDDADIIETYKCIRNPTIEITKKAMVSLCWNNHVLNFYEHIENPNEDVTHLALQKAEITDIPRLYEGIKNLTEDVTLCAMAAYAPKCMSIHIEEGAQASNIHRTISKASDAELFRALIHHGGCHRNSNIIALYHLMDHPSDEMTLKAMGVVDSGEVLELYRIVKEPSPEVSLKALDRVTLNNHDFVELYKSIKSPDKQMAFKVLDRATPNLLLSIYTLIGEITEEMMLIVLDRVSADEIVFFFEKTKEPTEKVTHLALERSSPKNIPQLYRAINRPTEEMTLKAVKRTSASFELYSALVQVLNHGKGFCHIWYYTREEGSAVRICQHCGSKDESVPCIQCNGKGVVKKRYTETVTTETNNTPSLMAAGNVQGVLSGGETTVYTEEKVREVVTECDLCRGFGGSEWID